MFAKDIRVLLCLVLCWSSAIWARNTPSSRPSEQPTPLPELAPKTATPFVLPPLERSTTPMSQPMGKSLRLKHIRFSGNTVFSDAVLQQQVQEFLQRELDVGELEALRFKVTQFYQQHGYVSSGALIPEQKIQDGSLMLQIVEGKLAAINLSGQEGLQPEYIRRRLPALDQPLNVQTLQQRYALLLQDPLILALNGSLKPLDKLGSSILDIQVTRAQPYQLTLHLNNYNPPSIGAEQLQVEGWVRNLSGWGDKVDFRYDVSKGSANYAGGVTLPLNAYGTLAAFSFETGQSAIIEEPLNKADIRSDVRNFTGSLTHPVYQDLQHSLNMGLSFSSKRNQTQVLNTDFSVTSGLGSGVTRVSALRVFQEYVGRFDAQVVALRSTFSTGIDVFNPTRQTQVGLPGNDYFAWLGQLQYALQLQDNGTQLRVRGNLQLSDTALLAQERIAVGGVYSVRGYRENELVRAQGYSGSLELHYPLYATSGSFANRLLLIPFMDYGSAWNPHETAEYLHAIGVGLNWQFLTRLKADIYYAHTLNTPRHKAVHDLQDDGVFFNLSVNLL